MKLPLKIAITGGLSSGKSTVCRFFKELGSFVISADDIVHQLLSPDTTIGKEAIRLIGSEILIDGKISRKKIAEKIFKEPQLLQSIEQLIHPAVKEEMDRLYAEVAAKGEHSLFVMEIPLLFEAGGKAYIGYDYSIALLTDAAKCKERFFLKHAHSDNPEEQYRLRAKRLVSDAERKQKADFLLYNQGSIEELRTAVQQLYLILLTNESVE